jgi:radical SAM superfamily enzyme YgiQ (UPF0313 family)
VKLTLIRPNMGERKAADTLQPLAIAVLAGLTPPEVEIEFVDDRIEAIPWDRATDLVALSVETFTARRAYRIASHFKQRGIPVIMGGYHPSFETEEALNFADTVVCGDAEGIWEQVMADGLKGGLKRVYYGNPSRDLQGVKYDRSLFKGKKYAPLFPVQFGRGCRYACDFCSIHAFYRNNLRQRPLPEVVAEIAESGHRYFLIVDDNLLIDSVKTGAFLSALKPLKIRWVTQISIDITHNSKLLQLMAESGCLAVMIGFESLDPRNLAQMGKRANLTNRDYALAVKKLRDLGIMVYGSFLFGYDFDTRDSFEPALEFAIENQLFLANFNPLTPMPGTGLYHRLRAENRLIYEVWWNDPYFKYGDAVFQPRGMTATELTDGCRSNRYRFNRYSSMLRRMLDSKANGSSLENLAIFCGANWISRIEIHAKQGAELGGASGTVGG